MWNARVPPRFPDVIVRARHTSDVVLALKIAKQEGLRVGVRSGGHSWAGNHVRNGGMLLDLSELRDVTVDEHRKIATTGPGRAGHELAEILSKRGLFFPTGHCKGVCVGGYLLQGGFGWNSRALGPACESVIGLDIVTADGEQIFASERENPDFYWAARGAGPGFFGVVTRFHLRVHEKPRAIAFALHTYKMTELEEVFRWAHKIREEVSETVELQIVASRSAFGARGPGLEIFAPVFADSYRDAWRALSFLNSAPFAKKAAFRLPLVPATLDMMYRMVGVHYPDEHRYAVDNLWTHAPIDDLLPGIEKSVATLPPSPSHLFWLNWAPPPRRSDMAFSVEDQIYIALYGIWKDASDDERYAPWAETHVREMQHLASGCQLADENLGKRPFRFMTENNLARLDKIRAQRDPMGRFHPWMGRPS